MEIKEFEHRLQEGGFHELCRKQSLEKVVVIERNTTDSPDITEWVFEGTEIISGKMFKSVLNISDTLTNDGTFNLADIAAHLIGEDVRDFVKNG